METPEQFASHVRDREYYLHVALLPAGIVLSVVALVYVSATPLFVGTWLLASGCILGSAHFGGIAGRTPFTGWGLTINSADSGMSVEENYTTKQMDDMNVHERLAFARRVFGALWVFGVAHVVTGVSLAWFK